MGGCLRPDTRLTFVSLCDNDVGEVEGVLDANNKVLHWWCLNDANWRSEYFDPLMKELGIEFNYDSTEEQEKILKQDVMECLGMDEE